MQSSCFSSSEVQKLQHYASNLGNSQALKSDDKLAHALALALRSDMHPLTSGEYQGIYRDDAFDEAEADYRQAVGQRRPIYRYAKFRLFGVWYLYESRLIREALEINRQKRSDEAVWLEVLLRSDEIDDYALFRARKKLLKLHRQLQPI